MSPTFQELRAANVDRCEKWHPQGLKSWSPSDWLTAVTGELGELASLLKMRNRERDGMPGNKFSPTDQQIADELADVVTYLDLLSAALGVDLGAAVVEKFNEVSERVGFPDRIEVASESRLSHARVEDYEICGNQFVAIAVNVNDAAETATSVTTVTRTACPNPVMQTTPTNCFRACVATILNLSIEDVPAACDGATWDWNVFQDWLAKRGLQAIELGFGNGGTIYPVRKPVRCIVSGPAPRECATERHAVVGSLLGLEGFELEHDPHPSELWLDGEPTHATFFVPI